MFFSKFKQRADAPCSDSLGYVLHKPSRTTYILKSEDTWLAIQFAPAILYYLKHPERYTTTHILQHTKLMFCREISTTEHTSNLLQRCYTPVCVSTALKLIHITNMHLHTLKCYAKQAHLHRCY